MSNMSYCRFENTLSDLQDCYNNWEGDDYLLDREAHARSAMLRLCQQIVTEFGDGDELDVRDDGTLRAT